MESLVFSWINSKSLECPFCSDQIELDAKELKAHFKKDIDKNIDTRSKHLVSILPSFLCNFQKQDFPECIYLANGTRLKIVNVLPQLPTIVVTSETKQLKTFPEPEQGEIQDYYYLMLEQRGLRQLYDKIASSEKK